MSDTLPIAGGEFYVVMAEETVLTADQDTAIQQLKEEFDMHQNGDQPQIIHVEYKGAEEWTLRELEWKQIALELMNS